MLQVGVVDAPNMLASSSENLPWPSRARSAIVGAGPHRGLHCEAVWTAWDLPQWRQRREELAELPATRALLAVVEVDLGGPSAVLVARPADLHGPGRGTTSQAPDHFAEPPRRSRGHSLAPHSGSGVSLFMFRLNS